MEVNFLNQDINKQDLNSELSSGYSLEKTEWNSLKDITPVTFKQFLDFQVDYVEQAAKSYAEQIIANRHDQPPANNNSPDNNIEPADNNKKQLLMKIGELLVNAAKHAEVAGFNKLEEQNPNLTPENYASTQADYIGNHL